MMLQLKWSHGEKTPSFDEIQQEAEKVSMAASIVSKMTKTESN